MYIGGHMIRFQEIQEFLAFRRLNKNLRKFYFTYKFLKLCKF